MGIIVQQKKIRRDVEDRRESRTATVESRDRSPQPQKSASYLTNENRYILGKKDYIY
jgi:hypothetical protein